MIKLHPFLLWCIVIAFIDPVFADNKDYFDMSLEELMNVQVTSASKKSQQLSDVAAAVFVINQEDIKRSGATSIPEALRMAPGIEVSRMDSSKWSVSARGFNGRFANKLLVLIDGRSVYTLAFSGVYWENQDIMMEDIERIEVIRGPGAALWGANAVNGVINIITKHSANTQGGLVTAGAGSKENGFGSARYGVRLNPDTTARAYFKGFDRGDFKLLDGRDARDNFNNLQGGFRIDSNLTPKDSLTVSADAFTSEIRENLSFATVKPPFTRDIIDTTKVSGGNLRSNFTHTFSPTSSYALQFYYDIYKRLQPFDSETRQTVDIEFQHNFQANSWNEIVWGMSYRYMDGDHTFPLPEVFTLTDPNPQNHYYSLFAKDEITLLDDELWLTLGSKFEHNDFTGFEIQPTARLLWAPHEQHRFWGALSRAVRTPSIIDESLNLVGQFIPPPNPTLDKRPIATVITGSHAFTAEDLLAFELGYRSNLDNAFSLDATVFYNDYSDMRLIAPINPIPTVNQINLPLVINNNGGGHTKGFETSLVWQMLDWWRWDFTYSYLYTHLKSNDFLQETQSPQHKTSIRAVMSPWHDVDFDLWLRYSDKTSFFTINGPYPVSSYVTMDARLAWKPIKNIELSLIGQNLLDSNHLESAGEAFANPTQIPRSFYGKIAWEF
ncbi:MAG: TonB-dependent receptor [Methylococcaceae bacterium]|nr:TonB-dependent receptor [Methylococcaceae bacterium]